MAFSDVLTFAELSSQGDETCFSITLINDDAFEREQSFIVSIDSVTTNVLLENPNITVVIISDDSKLIHSVRISHG